MHKLLTLTAGLTIAAGVLIPAGIASAHSSGHTLTNATCHDTGYWTADYNVTATNPELNPQVTINNPASPYTVSVPAAGYHHTFNIAADVDTFTVSAVVAWSDGFTKNLGSLTATRPGTCPPPTTVGPPTSPPATTVAPPATTVPPEATTITQPVVTTLAPPTTITNQPLPTNPAAASQKIGALPTTGTATDILIGIGAAILIAGILLLAAASDRRKNRADR